MAEEQKPTEVPQEAAPAAEPIAAEPVTEAPKAEEAPAAAESSEAPKAAEEAPAAEEPAKEVKPVEEGHLDYKVSNFPKNLLYSKKFFWFGSDAVDHKKLSQYVKAEKEAAHHILSWASETGKGLLFFSENRDKAAPQGVIQLSDVSEPATEGSNKFHFSLRGNKYTFKAPNAADRDNWVNSIKAKIAEAKELATSVTEGETYKKTLDGLKPKPFAAPVKKEEKKEDKPVEAAAAGAAAGAVATEAAATETPAAAPAPAAEAKKDTKLEDSKRRSSSRKRASIFGDLFAKKEGKEKKADAVTDNKAAESAAPAEAAATETPAVATEETPAVPAAEPVSTEAPAAAAAAEVKAEEAKPEVKEAAKPAPSKRNSVFGNFSFGKKKPAAPEAEAAPTTPAKDTPAEPAPASDAAPVIPAVETTEPLSAEVNSPATVPVETVEVKPATNGDTKKEVKSEKRKASLPFNFGKKEKSPASDDDTEKPKSSSPFSKLRQTIKGKGKAAEKPSEKSEKVEPEAEAAEASTAEPAAAEEAPKTEAAAPAPAEETPAEQPIATSTPTVAATA